MPFRNNYRSRPVPLLVTGTYLILNVIPNGICPFVVSRKAFAAEGIEGFQFQTKYKKYNICFKYISRFTKFQKSFIIELLCSAKKLAKRQTVQNSRRRRV